MIFSRWACRGVRLWLAVLIPPCILRAGRTRSLWQIQQPQDFNFFLAILFISTNLAISLTQAETKHLF